MPALGPVVLGAIAVFLLVLVSLVVQGRRQMRARQSQRSDLGLQRVAIPDPVLTASILAACPAGLGEGDAALAGLERVTIEQPGAWYVAMVRPASVTGAAGAGAMRVLLVIDGLPRPSTLGEPAASAAPVVIDGTNGLWTRRWASGLLVVEGVPGAGDAVRDFEKMRDAGARAVAAAAR